MSGFIPDARFKTELALDQHFEHQIAPLRAKIAKTTFEAVAESDFDRAVFVFKNGGDVITYYQARRKLSDYHKRHLDDYIDRQLV